MIYDLTIKLTSTFIGSKKADENNVRKITKVDDCNPKIFVKHLKLLCEKYAKEELKIEDYSFNDIIPDGILRLEKPTETKLHYRNFHTKESRELQTEIFESYPVGTVAHLNIKASSYLSKDQVIAILSFIGKFNGISQFGMNWGYGKFDIVEVTETAFGIKSQSDTFNPDNLVEA